MIKKILLEKLLKTCQNKFMQINKGLKSLKVF